MTKLYIYDKSNKVINKSLYDSLPKQIQERVSKYKIEDDYNSSLIAWSILTNKLNQDFNIVCEEIKESKYNKPYIENIYFNITHSHSIVGVIISNEECGIDIELINNKLDHNLLSKKILSSTEYTEYLKSANQQEYIIMKWTQKEAHFKKVGTGIVRSNLSYIDTSEIYTTKIKDANNNDYYMSYVSLEKPDIYNL